MIPLVLKLLIENLSIQTASFENHMSNVQLLELMHAFTSPFRNVSESQQIFSPEYSIKSLQLED